MPDDTNSPGSQEPRISKTESTAHVSDLTSDKFCRFLPIVQNSVLPRYGSPAIKNWKWKVWKVQMIRNGVNSRYHVLFRIQQATVDNNARWIQSSRSNRLTLVPSDQVNSFKQEPIQRGVNRYVAVLYFGRNVFLSREIIFIKWIFWELSDLT